MLTWLRSVHREYLVELRAEVDAEAGPGPQADRQLMVVILTVLGCLILMNYYGNSGRMNYPMGLLEALGFEDGAKRFAAALTQGEHQRFARKVFWAGSRVVGYVLLPMTVALIAFRGGRGPSLTELFGLRTDRFFAHWRAYAVMLAVIAPFVFGASFSPAFQHKYPYYKLAAGESLWPWFVAWEILYALQFLGLEIFYRGFMVHGLKARLGHASIFVMMLPYMMIHYGKPLPECVGSIIAGFVLGTMSMKSGAIWWGAALHIIVAWTMDFLSLWHRGYFG